MYLMEISKEKLNNLKKWYVQHGLVPTKKLSGRRKNSIENGRHSARNPVW